MPQTQTVSLTVTAKSLYSTGTQTIQESGSWTLSFKNPCKDPDFVKIVPSTLPEIDYVILSGEQSTKTDAFTLEINPETHNLCGPLKYTAYYDNQPDPEDGIADPFGFTPGSEPIVSVKTEDPNLAGLEKPWKIVAEFRDWPTDGDPIDDPAQSAEATSVVRYINGCNNPTSFAASSQPAAAEFTFTGGATTNKINDFSVVPVNCEIEYAC